MSKQLPDGYIWQPVEVFCPLCGLKVVVKSSDHSWPRCPHCDEPMRRQGPKEEDGP